MPDFPKHYAPRMAMPYRDWMGMIGYIWSTVFENLTPLRPRETYDESIFIVPGGMTLALTEVSGSGSINGRGGFYVAGVTGWYKAWTFARQHIFESYAVPLIILARQELRGRFINDDIIPGYGYMALTGWLQPASVPEEPKSEDPLDLFKAGKFNYCQTFVLVGGETLRIFPCLREKKVCYLRVKDLYLPSEKKLASFYLKPEEAQEIISTLRAKPEEAQEFLKRIEKKYLSSKNPFSL